MRSMCTKSLKAFTPPLKKDAFENFGDSIKLHYLENKDELRKSKKSGFHENIF